MDPWKRDGSLREFVKSFGTLSESAFVLQFRQPFVLTSVSLDPKTWDRTLLYTMLKLDVDDTSSFRTIEAAPQGIDVRRLVQLTNRITVGRSQDNDIVVPSKNVSKHHAVLVGEEEKWVVVDLDSSNGTRVEGKDIAPGAAHPLERSPTTIQFADAAFVFLMPREFHALLGELRRSPSTSSSRIEIPTLKEDELADDRIFDTNDPDATDTNDLAFQAGLHSLQALGDLVKRVEVLLLPDDQALKIPAGDRRALHDSLVRVQPHARLVRAYLKIGDPAPLTVYVRRD